MDPVSAFGVASGAVQIAQVVVQTMKGLATLRGKFSHADLTIRSLIGELSTIKSAVIQLDELANYNARNSLEVTDYDEGLNVALDGCRAIMDVLKEEVATLAQDTAHGTAVGFRARAKVVWNEDIMRDHQDRLHAQVLALQLLLQACQCRSSSEQVGLLRKAENRQIIKKVADDTATLRSRSHYAVSHTESASLVNGQPSVGDTVFDFDDTVMDSHPYREALGHSRSISDQPVTHGRTSGFTDEGYATGALNTPNASIPSRSPTQLIHPDGSVAPDFGRRKTVPFRPGSLQQNQSDVQRWQSDSTTNSSLGSRSSGSRREKFRSILRRLSTPGATTPVTSPTVESAGGRRSRGRDFNTSIDLKTLEGASAPLIVKMAQKGSRVDVERLIENRHDIEARHIHSRRNALLVAAHCGNEEIVDVLIKNNTRLDVADGSGSTALHLAASRDHVEVLELLLLENVGIEARDSQGRTALWLAASQGQLDATRMLVTCHAKVNSRANNQMTALHAAAKRGDAAIVELLISQGADLEAKDFSMMTALHYASEAGNLGVIELLLNSKMDINAPGSDRRTPLICAAAMDKLPVVQILLKKKASPGSVDEAGMTALHWAAFNGHTEIVSLLSQKKGSLSVTNIAGRTALHLAVMNVQFAVAELLLRRNDVALETRCESGLTPLHYACISDNLEITKLLLATGSDIEAQTIGDQRTPVHIAAARGSMALLNLLCDKGASLEARDAVGDRALCVACRQGRAAAAQNLLNRGSPPYQRFGNGLHEDSSLCLAAMGGHRPVVSLLLQNGASIKRSDETGWWPARYAAYHGHPEVLELLLSNSPTPEDDGDELGRTAERITFAPHATISEERKRGVQEVLRRSRRPALASAPRPLRPIPVTSSEPVHQNEAATAGPQELPGTLEQGLPSSRSVTPDQMRRDPRNQPDSTNTQVVGMDYLQQALPPTFEQEPVVAIQQPLAINASVEQWVDRMQTSSGIGPLPPGVPSPAQVSVSTAASDTHEMSRRLHTLIQNHSTDDNEQSETSSVSSVYTALEGETIYELSA